jgi:hypothetical protein
VKEVVQKLLIFAFGLWVFFACFYAPGYSEYDKIAVEVWTKNSLGYQYGFNTQLFGKNLSRNTHFDGKIRKNTYFKYENYDGKNVSFTFRLIPFEMDFFRIKIFRNGVLCKNAYKNFNSTYRFIRDYPNVYEIVCDSPKQ